MTWRTMLRWRMRGWRMAGRVVRARVRRTRRTRRTHEATAATSWDRRDKRLPLSSSRPSHHLFLAISLLPLPSYHFSPTTSLPPPLLLGAAPPLSDPGMGQEENLARGYERPHCPAPQARVAIASCVRHAGASEGCCTSGVYRVVRALRTQRAFCTRNQSANRVLARAQAATRICVNALRVQGPCQVYTSPVSRVVACGRATAASPNTPGLTE
mmetsp:Transcript_7538/g.15340  ORF Transcript_7538/g.15340 Transcript_7538/m.15340 type:complete len:213 (+) Transcript_7538:197-835(+)